MVGLESVDEMSDLSELSELSEPQALTTFGDGNMA